MNAPALLVEREGAVLTLVINDAPWNRMSVEFVEALESEVVRIAQDDGIRAVVLRGAGGQNFSVGMDLKQLMPAVEEAGGLDPFFDRRLRLLEAIENLGKPVLAVLCGHCLGAGLELPLACHFRLAAEEGAQIGLPELDLGTVPAWGGSARLVRLVGRQHALDMILRSRRLSGPEALGIGLVDQVWPNGELFRRAAELAGELAGRPAGAVTAMLRCVVGTADGSLAEALAAERTAVKSTFRTPDFEEGMQAFREKRAPRFNR